MKNIHMALAGLLVVTGCASVSLNQKGNGVRMLSSAPAGCEILGAVVGQGGGAFTFGSLVSNETLINSAINDARNKGAELGATHVVLDTPKLLASSAASASTVTAVATGMAYACPKQVTEAP